MDMVQVDSSNIKAIGHEGSKMRVRFSSGKEYDYEGVSTEVHRAFLTAESKGKFFSSEIRPKFQGVRVSEENK